MFSYSFQLFIFYVMDRKLNMKINLIDTKNIVYLIKNQQHYLNSNVYINRKCFEQ